MTNKQTFLIAGGGLAGATAAVTLREEGFDGRVAILGEETRSPYERPALSKEFLRGEKDEQELLVKPDAFYAEHSIEVLTETRVVELDPAGRSVVTEGGTRMAYDQLLLATGSSARRLDIPGAELDGIHYLRTTDDANAIRTAASSAGRAVVVGGGWIGSEVAASLRQLGLSVALVAPAELPLLSALGSEVATIYRDLHLENGVELHMSERVVEFVGQAHVTGVRTASGSVISGDMVVVGVGAEPRVELARAVGLVAGDAVPTDDRLLAAPSIHAAGDIADAWHPVLGYRVRVEHWDNAKRQGAAAAHNMLGRDEPYDRLPYLYSDQFDLGMEYVGHAPEWDEVVIRGDAKGREFIAFWLRDGRVKAAMNANIWKVNKQLRELIAAGEVVARDALRDADVPLAELVAGRHSMAAPA